jgi:hypothetical protein
MRKSYCLLSGLVLSLLGFPSFASVQIFEGSFDAWLSATGTSQVNTVTFDTIPGSITSPINGNEFGSFPGEPIFTSIVGGGVYVGKLASNQIQNPPSAPNMLSPSSCNPSCEGIVRLSFNESIKALGATFVDVEDEFKLTGYSLVLDAPSPNITFTSAPGDLSFKFLGFVSDVPFTSVDIHFTTGPSIDGALLDNLVYAPVPEPEAYAMLLAGLGLVGFIARRRKQVS